VNVIYFLDTGNTVNDLQRRHEDNNQPQYPDKTQIKNAAALVNFANALVIHYR
jgi:hypothetical protein